MKKSILIATLALVLIIGIILSGCDNNSSNTAGLNDMFNSANDSSSVSPDDDISSDVGQDSSVTEPPDENDPNQEITVYADMRLGDDSQASFDLVFSKNTVINTEYLIEYIHALTEWTGIYFTLNEIYFAGDTFYIDWAVNSSIFTGDVSGATEQMFDLQDISQLRWFMLDSVTSTIQGNFGSDYYVMHRHNGHPLEFDAIEPYQHYVFEYPYLYSSRYFYEASVGNTGGINIKDPNGFLVGSKGTWMYDGGPGTAYIVMDGIGNFFAYYANGSLEAEGVIIPDENGSYFNLVAFDGTTINTFYFADSDTIFMTSNESTPYTRESVSDHPD